MHIVSRAIAQQVIMLASRAEPSFNIHHGSEGNVFYFALAGRDLISIQGLMEEKMGKQGSSRNMHKTLQNPE